MEDREPKVVFLGVLSIMTLHLDLLGSKNEVSLGSGVTVMGNFEFEE